MPVGGGTVVDQATVLTQPSAGTFRAFSAECPHAGCAVSTVADGAITCPCHGSTFDADSGAVTAGPATSGLQPRPVKREGDTLVVG